MEMKDIYPQQVVFHQELHRNENAVVFLISVSGFECVMKVVSITFKLLLTKESY